MHDALAWMRASAIPLATVKAANGLADLEPLRALIVDARIVSLGEATHATREFFQLKHRLLEFCVAELGFTVFAMEESFSRSLLVNDYVVNGTGSAADALSSFKWCWQTEEVLALIEWIRAWNETHARKVKFYGFDMSPSAPALIGLGSYLRRVADKLAAECEALLAPLSSNFTEFMLDELPSSVREAMLACVERVIVAFACERVGWVGATSEIEWRLARQQAVELQQEVRMMSALAESGSEMGAYVVRDRAMAENVRNLLDMEGDDAKAVLWSHNLHAGRSSFLQNDASHPFMGLCLHELFGSRHLVAGFVFDQGSFRAWSGGAIAEHSVPPAPAGSFEAPFAAVGLPLYALDLRNAPSEGSVADWLLSRPSRSFGGGYSPESEREREEWLEAIWRRRIDMFDLVIYVGTTTASRPIRSIATEPPSKCSTVPKPANLDLLEGDGLPRGWTVMTAEDSAFPHTIALSDAPSPSGGHTVSISRHSAPWPWGEGVLAQRFDATPWRGQRLRFGASIRTTAKGFGAGAQIYVRAWSTSGDGGGAVHATLADGPARSAQWGKYTVELDVPTGADVIEVGLISTGNGSASFGDLELKAR